MSKEPGKITSHTWYKDTRGRIWVILNVLPFGLSEPKEVMMLELGASEAITRPYTEIVNYVEEKIMIQI